MAMIEESSVREVLAKTRIVEVVGEFVTLKKAGARQKGLCPFHNEKTPSFTVNDDLGFFHCFGCGESGDAISFLSKHNGLTFVEAVEHLASRAGVRLERSSGTGTSRDDQEARARVRQRREGLYSLTARAADWFHQQLKSAPADATVCRYLKERGLTSETVERFRLGFAPDNWDGLTAWLAQNRARLEDAETLGLIAPRKSGRGFYDRFRNRLIFPIFDLSERIIAFGGRVLPSADDVEGAKYINSPDSPIYTKGDVLFGLAQAKRTIRSEGTTVLVEGNIDVLTLHQEGITGVVAPMGTALTPAQVQLMRRFANEVVLLYDGDVAGRAAARKSLPLLLSAGLHGRVAVLADGEDPDTLARERGIDAVSTLVAQAIPLMEFLIDETVASHGLTDHGRAQALAELAPYVSEIRDFRKRDLVVARVASALSLSEGKVAGMLRNPGAARARVDSGAPEAPGADLPLRERRLVETCLAHPTCLPIVEDAHGPSWIEHEGLRAIMWEAITLYGEEERVDPGVLLDRLASSPLSRWVAGVFCGEPEVGAEGAHEFVESCIELLRGNDRKRRVAELQREMERAEREGDPEKFRELMEEKLALSRDAHGPKAAP